MKVNISDIVKTDGASLDINYNEVMDDLKTIAGNEFTFENPVRFEGKLVNISGVMKLDGRLSTEYSVKCYRCLKEVTGKLDIGIKESFVDVEKVEDKTDIETYTYEGYYIEVDKVLIDNIVLNLPMKQVCEAECKGICPKCGIDLNSGECECIEDEINPRMAVLKDFFKS
ncbi:MAG: DUF177 domain-containing protein [Clostridia bacterium]|nr:DUF177 domain-containing protein [Clostridia bacterium]